MGEYRCHRCGAAWESQARQPGVKEICDACGAYLHCCKNCSHHRRDRHNQCYIPNTDWVGDRATLNFCDEFSFQVCRHATVDDDGGTARSAAQALLGETGETTPTLDQLFDDARGTASPPRDFDALFGE